MSNPDQICRNTYFNYGSYLRSRGYDQSICRLMNDIEQGLIPIGPIISNGKCGATMHGTFTITSCPPGLSINNETINPILGRLVASGGYVGTPSDPATANGGDSDLSSGPDHFSIQANHGIQIKGPIFSDNTLSYYTPPNLLYGDTTLRNTNVFIGDKTYFYGISTDESSTNPGDFSHNVRISGDLDVYHDIQCNNDVHVDNNIHCVGNAYVQGDISCQNLWVLDSAYIPNQAYMGSAEVLSNFKAGEHTLGTYSLKVEPPTSGLSNIYMNNLPDGTKNVLSVDDDGLVYARASTTNLEDELTALKSRVSNLETALAAL